MKKILIITKRNLFKDEDFVKASNKVGNVKVQLCTFSDINYKTVYGKTEVYCGKTTLSDFDLIYFRVVGVFFETASIVADYAKNNNIPVVDQMYKKIKYMRLPVAKGLESKILIDAKIPHPATMFGSILNITKKAEKDFGYPFVIKGTNGKQGNAVWSPQNKKELKSILKNLIGRESQGENFIVQEFVRSSSRIRVFVIGDSAKAAITRPTRWVGRFNIEGGSKKVLNPIPKAVSTLSVNASKILGIDIAGVDVLVDDSTGKNYILEVNSAPRWESIKNDAGLKVEEEIIRFLITKCR